MNRAMMVSLFGLLCLGAAQTALAQTDPWLVLVSGNDVITYDGSAVTCEQSNSSVSCSTFGTVKASNDGSGDLVLTATNFNGWDIKQNTGTTGAPDCTTDGFCTDQTQIDVDGGSATANLTSYFGAAGFASGVAAVVDTTADSDNGTGFTSTGYYLQPKTALTNVGYSTGMAPTLTSWSEIGGATGAMSFPVGDGGPQSTSSALETSEGFDLTNVMVFNDGTTESITDTITAVPEPASFILVGGVLLAIATGLRRKLLKTV